MVYHRVAEEALDPQLLCVTPQHFAAHLELLRTYGQPLSLQGLLRALESGQLPPRAFVVTFDDGYADNLHHAKPLLERYEIPATVFISTGYVAQQREFWWDVLARLLLRPGTLPDRLSLRIGSTDYHWRLGKQAVYPPTAYERQRHWHVLASKVPGPRQRLYGTLCQLLRPLPEEERSAQLDALQDWAGVAAPKHLPHRPLCREDIVQLASSDLLDIGAHTITHPVLTMLPRHRQQQEIIGSKMFLEALLGRPVRSFAYPYGSRRDYTAETTALVRQSGFAVACANVSGAVQPHTDRWQLPRVLVRNWPRAIFARTLAAWARL